MDLTALIDPETLKGLVAGWLTGGLAWIGMAGRKAVKNLGKTKIALAKEALERSMQALEAAKLTPDQADDAETAKMVEMAQKHLDSVRQFAALTEAVGDSEAVEQIVEEAPAVLGQAVKAAVDPASAKPIGNSQLGVGGLFNRAKK